MEWTDIFYAIFVGKCIKLETNRYRTCTGTVPVPVPYLYRYRTGTGTVPVPVPVRYRSNLKKIFFSAKAFSKARILIQTRRIGGYE